MYILFICVSVIEFSIVCTQNILYTNEWVVQIDGDADEAKQIALKHGLLFSGEIYPNVYHFTEKQNKRSMFPHSRMKSRLLQEERVFGADQSLWKKRHTKIHFTDTNFGDMWYLTNIPSMKIEQAWIRGFHGENIVIGIVDEGVEILHPDLRSNINQTLSVDFIPNDNDSTPSNAFLGHGTKCAGVAAAVANNSLCGCGIAFKSTIAGIRSSNGGSTSVWESKSLTHKWNDIHIYSNSWGAQDKKGFEGPDNIVFNALKSGVENGRNGKGSIYVWAAGNGEFEDNCNADGYANSIYTITISSVKNDGYPASFSEICAAAIAVTYSGGIITTAPGGLCDQAFTGTSASTPLAAGIIALALQANKALTWRDVQYLIINTAKMKGLQELHSAVNGAGRNFSHYFGFGLIDAEAMVKEALNWTLVPRQRHCVVPTTSLSSGNTLRSHVYTTGCKNSFNEVKYIEHVVCRITFWSERRGEVGLYLTSPMGTPSKLLTRRPRDYIFNGTHEWTYTSIHFWGEQPEGNWTLEMIIGSRYLGRLIDWNIDFYGTKIDPKLGKENETDSVTKPSTPPSSVSPTELSSTKIKYNSIEIKEPTIKNDSVKTAVLGSTIFTAFLFATSMVIVVTVYWKKKCRTCPEINNSQKVSENTEGMQPRQWFKEDSVSKTLQHTIEKYTGRDND